MKIYIAGKIAGEPNYKAKFEAAARQLREEGHLPLHSAAMEQGFAHEDYMRICRAMIDVCEAVCLLPGWEQSEGAKQEYAYARKLRKEITHYIQKLDLSREVMELFNSICISLPKVREMTDTRRRTIRARGVSLEEFKEIFEAVHKSGFLTGKNERGWRADFDWIMKPANWVKIREGVYANKAAKTAFNSHPQKTYSEAELSHLFVDLNGEEEE